MKSFALPPSRRLNGGLVLGLLVVFLTAGCAHRGRPQVAAEIPASSVSVSESTVAGSETDAEDDFFDDEFETEGPLVADPLIRFNRLMFQFNDKLYFWCLKPVARGYRVVVPEPVRLSLKNLFNHVGTPIRLANDLLQGKFKSAGAEFGKFFVNSTAGLLGLGNPAANFPALNPDKEDLGQTLATYGIGNGFYLVLPIFGPSTLRDTVGLVGDFVFDPITYLHPWYVPLSIRAENITNDLSFRIGDYEALKSAALDPYLMLRSAYIQHRRKVIDE
ncbi:MAG: VacJ family lipoprotein [Deltaproteobacteria bacterium]|nr:MAG: VacJ family lipoprotein [Deltaproteobacteria bacterium]